MPALILIGALSSALLSYRLFNLLLKWMEKAKLRTIFAAFAVSWFLDWEHSIRQSLASSEPEKENLVIAGKLGPEPEILMPICIRF